MKALKILLLSFLILIAFGAISLFTLNQLIDPNQIKSQVIKQLSAHTRGELSIKGDLSWSIFPNLGIQLQQLSYQLPEDTDQPFALLNEAILSIKLLPLFRLAIEVDGLSINGLLLNLHTDEAGKNNWENLITEPSKKPSEANQTKPSNNNQTAQLSPSNINIALVNIRNASVKYSQAQNPNHIELNEITIHSQNISTDGQSFPIDITYKATFTEAAITAHVQIKGSLSTNLHKQSFHIHQFEANTTFRGEPFKQQAVAVNITGNANYDATYNKGTVSDFNVNIADTVTAKLQLTGINLHQQPQFTGNIKILPLNTHRLLKALGQEPLTLNQTYALSTVSFDSDFVQSAKTFTLDPLTLTVDKSTFTGSLGIRDLATKHTTFNLQGNHINLDDYSTASTVSKDGEDENTQKTAQANVALLPFSALANLLFDGQLSINSIQSLGLKANNLSIELSGEKGLINLKKLYADLYDGNLVMNASLNTQSTSPQLAINTQLNQVTLQPLLEDFAQINTLNGTAQFNSRFKSHGKTSKEIQENLNGPIIFNITKATFSELNVDKLACQAIAQIRREPLLEQDWPTATTFKQLSGSIAFKNGIGHNNNLTAKLNNMTLNGEGNINLPLQNVDYSARIQITGDIEEVLEGDQKSSCTINPKYRHIAWPIKCKGSISETPGDLCKLDNRKIQRIASDLLKAEAKEKLKRKLLKENEDSLSSKDQLKKLLLEKIFN